MSTTKERLLLTARRTLPAPLYHVLDSFARMRQHWPPVGYVRFGSLRRVKPIDRYFGFDRGWPIDRYYIERFLAANAVDIQGRVLEIADNTYTRQFGREGVVQSDVLFAAEGNPKATFVGDLTCASHIPPDTFDCFILTQTLQYIYDLRSAVATIYRILKPGGVALVTVPGISQIYPDEWQDSWLWGFSTQSARKLFAEVFPSENVTMEAHGNVLAAIAFLHGLASSELRREELDTCDPQYQLLITIRAVKPKVMP